MPKLFMLVGVPGAGKSTWIKNQTLTNDAIILSTDAYIEDMALAEGKTYSAVFGDYIYDAVAQLDEDLEYAMQHSKDIIWDQTNLSLRGRREKLDMVMGSYEKIAVVFKTPDDIAERLKRREAKGKVIPVKVFDAMVMGYEPPTRFEGFSQIIEV
jgi:predicted kinase